MFPSSFFRSLFASAVLGLLLWLPTPAHASPITYDLIFVLMSGPEQVMGSITYDDAGAAANGNTLFSSLAPVTFSFTSGGTTWTQADGIGAAPFVTQVDGVAAAFSMLITKTTSPFRELSINANNIWNSQALPPNIGPSSGTYTVNVPEPTTGLLLTLGLVGLGMRRRVH